MQVRRSGPSHGPRRVHVRLGAPLAASLLASLLATRDAHAQDLCFPTPVALPGLSGPPDWKTPGTVRPELNEPRWAAAPQTGFESDGTDAEGLLRVMVDAAHTELSISFQAPTDPSTASNADAVYFGFTTDGTTGGLAKAVVISMPSSGTNPIQIDPAGVLVQGYGYDVAAAGHWTAAAPSWLREPAAWLGDPATAPGTAWGINFKVDIAAAGLATNSAFKMMFAMHKRDEGDVTPPFAAVDIWTPDPGANALFTGTLFIENPANWAPAVAIDAACVGGITLSGSQIGTRNVDAGNPAPNKINTTDGAVNNFYARPTYPAGLPGFAGLIEGKFHIANWGSIAASNAPWVAIPSGGAVANGAAPAPDLETLEFACPANAGGQTCGMATPAETHQCVYVELRAAPGQSAPFTRAAAYRNMDFEALSDFSAPAEISVKGLKQVFGNDAARDVYLYVHTRNMSPHQNEPLWLATDKMAATRRFAEVPPPAVAKQLRTRAVVRRGEPAAPRALPLPSTGIRDLDLSVHEALSAVWPTYDVHVYYDTGKVIPIGKVETSQLAPMYPFTYFYSHEGPLYGFSHALEGLDGVQVKELRPNVYLLQVPSESAVRISTRATAHETPKALPPPPVCPECPKPVPPPERGPCNCSIPGGPHRAPTGLALLGVALLGLALRVRRRELR